MHPLSCEIKAPTASAPPAEVKSIGVGVDTALRLAGAWGTLGGEAG